MEKTKLLPLGSVVYLREGIIPLLIVVRQPIVNLEDEVCYLDYAGVSQITGLDKEKVAYFNHEDISEILFEGYVGENEQRVLEALSEWREKHPEIPKKKVLQKQIL